MDADMEPPKCLFDRMAVDLPMAVEPLQLLLAITEEEESNSLYQLITVEERSSSSRTICTTPMKTFFSIRL